MSNGLRKARTRKGAKMGNLNAEQVIKALECCQNEDVEGCVNCPLLCIDACDRVIARYALSLIKELTEENDKLYRLVDDKIQENKRLSEENETLTIQRNAWAQLAKATQADTVRKMQERLKAHFDTYTDEEETTALYMRNLIDQIAKEMLGGEK